MQKKIDNCNGVIFDTGERILPAGADEVSFVYNRHKFAYEYIQSFVENKSVIDVGCGSGYGSFILAQKARWVLGIDHAADAIDFCCKHFQAANLQFQQADALVFQPPATFQAAVCLQVIEHFYDPAAFLDRLVQMVESGGTIFISTPNVRKKYRGTKKNPHHHSEMNYQQFSQLLRQKFQRFELVGIAYAHRNRLRSFLASMPFYQWGRYIKRSSKIKKIAGRVLDLNQFAVIDEQIDKRAADLLAICHVP